MKTRQILYAEDDMILTDGAIYGKIIYLADGVEPSSFIEITEEEYEAKMSDENWIRHIVEKY